MQLDCDFHIHSKYSGATSDRMDLATVSEQARLKGLDLVGTGDALHSEWLKEIRSLRRCGDGVYVLNDCKFIITVEVEDANMVHHLIFLPEISSSVSLRESFLKHSVDMDQDGRPHLRLRAEEIVELVREVEGLIGPSHAFVPWTSIYKEYDSLRECYGDGVGDVKFLELGLSADTDMADRIAELSSVTFLSNSDAHSPWPHRLGREFNRLELQEPSFDAIKNAFERKHGNRVILNIGLDPRLGKYHRTACIKCFEHYKLAEAESRGWRCGKCGGMLKKGVSDRIEELASSPQPMHPEHRPEYIRIAPLAEILALALKSEIYSDKVQNAWRALVRAFDSEIAVLIDVAPEEIAKIADERVAALIRSFRLADFRIAEGGGGEYGRILFEEKGKPGIAQMRLDTF